jgi:hypothetical protein
MDLTVTQRFSRVELTVSTLVYVSNYTSEDTYLEICSPVEQ